MSLFGHFCESVTKGVDDQFEAIGDFELGKDGTEVVGYGGLTDE